MLAAGSSPYSCAIVITLRRSALAGQSPAPVEPPTLARFVVLSMILHVLVVTLFGTTTGGHARRESGSSGSLDVTLRPLSREPGSGFRLTPGAETATPGTALLRRLGAATQAPQRATTPTLPPPSRGEVPAVPPPSATGTEARSPTPPSAAVEAGPVERAPAAREPAQPAQEALSPAPSTPPETLPSLDRNAPAEVDKPFAPAIASPPKAEREIAPAAEAPRAAPAVRELPKAPVAPQERVAPQEVRPEPVRPVESAAPPTVESKPAPPVEPPAREVPIAPAAPALQSAPRTIEREFVPPAAPAPREVPVPAAPPVEPAAPPRVVRDLAPAIVTPAPQTAAPDAGAAPERVAPQSERTAPPPAAPLPRSAPGDAATRVERTAPPAGAAERAAPVQPPPRSEAAPSGAPPRLRFGTPDGDDDALKPRRDSVAPSSDKAAPPRIDLEATRRRAREIAKEGYGYQGVVPLVPPPPPVERKSKLADAIEKALKPDCRDAYAGLGLLAVPALVASAVGDGGCRW